MEQEISPETLFYSIWMGAGTDREVNWKTYFPRPFLCSIALVGGGGLLEWEIIRGMK